MQDINNELAEILDVMTRNLVNIIELLVKIEANTRK